MVTRNTCTATAEQLIVGLSCHVTKASRVHSIFEAKDQGWAEKCEKRGYNGETTAAICMEDNAPNLNTTSAQLKPDV